jgi:glycosyltransferase involved in cell wall biosynthesis
MAGEKVLKVCSLHWGFIPGGGSAYARCLEDVFSFGLLRIKSFCINSPNWPCDTIGLKLMDVEIKKINSRLDPSWVWETRKFLLNEHPELILTHGFNGAFVAAVSSSGLSIPIVSSWHGDYFPTTLIQKIRKPFIEIITGLLFRNFVKEIVTVSGFSKKALIRKGVSSKKITVIHNGVADKAFEPHPFSKIKQDLHVPDSCILVGSVCRLDAAKGLPNLIQAAELALKQRDNLRFVILGEGLERPDLERLIRERGLEKYVLLPGYRPDIERCLPSLDIFTLSSNLENFSISILEAMRAGLPIVATNVGGNPEAIRNGIDGILVPPSNPEALSNEILALAGDKALRNRLGQSARQRFLQEFTADKMVRETAHWLVNCAQKYSVLR